MSEASFRGDEVLAGSRPSVRRPRLVPSAGEVPRPAGFEPSEFVCPAHPDGHLEGAAAMVEELTRRLADARAELAAARLDALAARAELGRVLRDQERLTAEQARLQESMAHRAMHDPLTGLANRARFHERLEIALATSERGVAVLWIDLDRFKEINDIFGHDVGDEMLVAVADRLRDVVRGTDDIARMGGDEFAIVLADVGQQEAGAIAERVLTALRDRRAFRLAVEASVGVSWQPAFRGDGPSLVRQADQAMYQAKAAGGGLAIAS